MSNNTVSRAPDEIIKLLMVTRGVSFDKAFKEVNAEFVKQHGYELPRDKVAKKVLSTLEKELKTSEGS